MAKGPTFSLDLGKGAYIPVVSVLYAGLPAFRRSHRGRVGFTGDGAEQRWNRRVRDVAADDKTVERLTEMTVEATNLSLSLQSPTFVYESRDSGLPLIRLHHHRHDGEQRLTPLDARCRRGQEPEPRVVQVVPWMLIAPTTV